jgi:hypothetical protein
MAVEGMSPPKMKEPSNTNGIEQTKGGLNQPK